ncbi:hypothetical protein ABZX12_22725 [Kribbella sp. NPDC003505]|uniref:hypothetical protein n=1 Tax=Kribbella sp. NPDC003505 TaxID=3154448 RepID=UPI0033A4689A
MVGLVEVAAAGGAAVVGAMATDAWRVTRDGIAKLFGRRGERDAVLAELEADAKQLAEADEDGREQVQQELIERWRLRLDELLGADPSAADELQRVLDEPKYVQTVVARDGGRAFGVQGGDLHYHEHRPATDDES